ncbi:FliC/FljB family flagellin [Salinisphaera sp. T31B1]|uniref:FliC/FljB family flagellin n=1 Tax=Salinisphaera sp. T31B1 TaxID=727963 RepID=UPI0033415B92
MSFTINTNTLSLVAQNNLSQSQKSLNSAIERLSSGSQINSAKDDAAGQAIANRMTSQIKGLEQASSNANDGISLAQTTEGALDQVNDNLQRVRELTVQAANGTNSASDLESIQNEIDQRLGEINRISEQTSFNGTNVLDGSKTEIKIQVGDKDDQTISINLSKMDSSTLGLDRFNVNGGGKAVTVDTSALTADDGGAGTDADPNVTEQLVSYQDDAGTTQYAVKTVTTNDTDGAVTTFTAATIDQDGTVADTGTDVTGKVSDAKDVQSDATVTSTGVTLDTSGVAADSSVVSYEDDNGNTQYAIQSGTAGDYSYTKADISEDGVVSDSGRKVDVGAGGTTAVNDGDFATNAKTSDPLAALDAALKQVDDLRSDLGAVQNRMDSAISNISTTTINISSARSRIEDTDYATEVSNMSKAQILQQAGTSVLAQANQTGQGVLSLLG